MHLTAKFCFLIEIPAAAFNRLIHLKEAVLNPQHMFWRFGNYKFQNPKSKIWRFGKSVKS